MENKLRLTRHSRENPEEGEHKLSKDRLKSALLRRIDTTMIGAIASIEKFFGEMWESDDPEGKEAYSVFQELRKEILDKGNDQKRQLERDFDQYQILWNRYVYSFKREG